MKRILPVLLCLILLIGCAGASQNIYRHSAFSAILPAAFEPVKGTDPVCFAPYGDPLFSSSITCYTTELNWYFDSFTEEEYADALRTQCGYKSIAVERIENTRVGNYDARRIACKVFIDQGTHDLILYAVNADRTYFFTLLNRDGDDYIDAFDSMMATVHFTEGK